MINLRGCGIANFVHKKFFSKGEEFQLFEGDGQQVLSGGMVYAAGANNSGAGVTPARNFLQAFGPGLFEQAHAMAGVLEFVDVCPYLSLPGVIVDGAGPARGAAGVEFLGQVTRLGRLRLQFDEDAPDFLNIVVLANHMLVPQQVTKTQLAGFMLSLSPGVEWAIFGPQLFS
jgi:hypothetical protein